MHSTAWLEADLLVSGWLAIEDRFTRATDHPDREQHLATASRVIKQYSESRANIERRINTLIEDLAQ